jgi:hypothetical protein
MLQETPETKRRSLFRHPLTYTSLLVLAVALYTGGIFYSRREEARAYEQLARQERARQQRERDQATIEQLGGSELAIEMLYATAELRRGETAQVCYGVANAKSVTLEPQANPVWPSHNRCVDVKPVKTTTYTLTATGADGRTLSREATVKVR